MANKTPLARWLYNNKSAFQAEFKELKWPEVYGIAISDFVTTLKVDGKIIEGRGADLSRDVALEKSVSEAIERYICQSLGFNSVGLSVSGVIDTEIHAINEIYERYYLDQHLKNNIPLFNYTCKIGPSTGFDKFAERNNLTVEHYLMNTPETKFGLVCKISSLDQQKTAFGFALSQNIEDAVDKSFYEALPNYAWLDLEKKNTKLEIPWHLEKDFIERLNSLFFDRKHKIDFVFPDPKIIPVDVNWQSLPLLKDIDLKISRFCIVEQKA